VASSTWPCRSRVRFITHLLQSICCYVLLRRLQHIGRGRSRLLLPSVRIRCEHLATGK
jgi:hypothetical protein